MPCAAEGISQRGRTQAKGRRTVNLLTGVPEMPVPCLIKCETACTHRMSLSEGGGFELGLNKDCEAYLLDQEQPVKTWTP